METLVCLRIAVTRVYTGAAEPWTLLSPAGLTSSSLPQTHQSYWFGQVLMMEM